MRNVLLTVLGVIILLALFFTFFTSGTSSVGVPNTGADTQSGVSTPVATSSLDTATPAASGNNY